MPLEAKQIGAVLRPHRGLWDHIPVGAVPRPHSSDWLLRNPPWETKLVWVSRSILFITSSSSPVITHKARKLCFHLTFSIKTTFFFLIKYYCSFLMFSLMGVKCRSWDFTRIFFFILFFLLSRMLQILERKWAIFSRSELVTWPCTSRPLTGKFHEFCIVTSEAPPHDSIRTLQSCRRGSSEIRCFHIQVYWRRS